MAQKAAKISLEVTFLFNLALNKKFCDIGCNKKQPTFFIYWIEVLGEKPHRFK